MPRVKETSQARSPNLWNSSRFFSACFTPPKEAGPNFIMRKGRGRDLKIARLSDIEKINLINEIIPRYLQGWWFDFEVFLNKIELFSYARRSFHQ